MSTHNFFSSRLCLIIVAIFAAHSAFLVAQVSMGLRVIRGPSPHPAVTLSDVSQADTATLFRGELSPLMPATFWLKNDDDRSIIAIGTIWTVTYDPGSTRTMRFTADSFLDRYARPVVQPHSRLLVGPRLWLPENGVEQYLTTEYFKRVQLPKLAETIADFGNASKVSVEVDSVIFSDGEVAGPNRMGLDSDISGRKAAAQKVVQVVKMSGSDPVLSRPVLLQLISGARVRGDRTTVWQHRFAQQLLHSPDFEGVLNYLERLPEAPAFYGHTSQSRLAPIQQMQNPKH